MHYHWSAVEIFYCLWQKMPFLSVIFCYSMSQQLAKEERICIRFLTVLSCLANFQYFCWGGWKKIIHSRKGSISRMGRKLHRGGEKALSDVHSLLWSQEIHNPFQEHTLPTYAIRPYYSCHQFCSLFPLIWFFPQCLSALPAIFASTWFPSFWDVARFIFTTHISRIK